MAFSWLERKPSAPDGSARRASVLASELADRAALLYRLGFTQRAATARLCASVSWEFEPASSHGPHRRPASLSDDAIGKIVAETFARRP